MNIIILAIFLCFGLSYFIGLSVFPWTSFLQDFLWFLGLLLFLIIFYKKNVNIPILLIPVFIICLIPFTQFLFDQVYYFSTAFFSICFLFGFLASIVYGYNSIQLAEKENIIKYIAYFFTVVGFISSLFAIAQWLQISHSYILNLSHNRPYANLGQPNHLATLLMLSICSLLYLYEHMKSKNIFLILLLPFEVWALALTQSRTAWVILFVLFIICIVKKIPFEKKSTPYIALTALFTYLFIFIFNAEISEYLNLVKPIPVQERLNGGLGRIEMWKHMYYAAMQQPWLGYGWFQTTIAQLEGVLLFKNEGNLSSAHNIMIDLVLWVGIPLALLIVGYSLYVIKRIFLSIHSLPQLYVFMMMLCILVHAQLEFPLYYSYFLFPLGFFIGLLLIDCNCKNFLVNEKLKQCIFLISICFYALIFKQYDQWLTNFGYASGMENTGESQHKKSIVFSQFADRAEFIIAKIDKRYAEDELKVFEYYVVSQPSYYNLFKMAQIFYFNENFEKANHYFEVSNALYNKNALFEDLSKIPTKNSNDIASLFLKNHDDLSGPNVK
ncbi:MULTISPECIES: O-antigen ligase family protein [Acinetobacter]|uniref:O-antigen ligase family protein n=1 Tax=Acinetobacter TaxID=469 RepID=UPI001443FC6D|nr:Wzy polymerase domain-containing protein [Acinetobacter indicus]MDM1291535.1 O-antigen ligase C-terminal domain-containing protein [Acinetobacter indicus]MDM1321482.1 O-antigen ligase C-terminal domain-containing protein [Acinetobacter indicus]MDM1333149.1 O-antigen ligase C-terminal domain-containing protein [Acinetobacter indicus]